MRELAPEPSAAPADRVGGVTLPARPGRLPARSGRLRRSSTHAFALPRGSARLVLVAVLAFAVVLLVALPASFSVDSWLALVAGRDIWLHGIPHHETLTTMAHGLRWVDQQWLAQVASYAIYRVGGLGLLGVINVALIVAGVAIVVVNASRRGVRLWVMLLMLILCLYQVTPFREVRTQAFAVPLIAAVLVLLSQDSRAPSKKVYWCLPLLVLWANLHGTASLAVGLVSLRGLTLAWDRRSELDRRSPRAMWAQLRRPLVLIVAAPLTLLVTPYGLQTIDYYRATLTNSSLAHFVTEWQPITSYWVLAGPFFILAGLMIWSFGRQPSATTKWEKLTLLILAAASIDVMRNDLLFGLAALLILPASLDRSFGARKPSAAPVRDRVNAILTYVAAAALVIAIVATLVRPAKNFDTYQRQGVLTAVRTAVQQDPSLKIMTDVRFADWLLWRDPQLSGRISNDARFELLSASQMQTLQRLFGSIGPDWKQGARGYRLLVLDRTADPLAVKGFLEEPGRQVLYNDGQRIVILRTLRAAA